MRAARLLACALALGCRGTPATQPVAGDALALVGARVLLPDGSLAPRTVHTTGAVIRAVDELAATPGERAIDLTGKVLVPALIDSHVHITFSTAAAELQGGLCAAIDLGAPLRIFAEAPAMLPFRLYPAGPIITAPAGYPLNAWGKDGYGLEVAGADAARAAVAQLADRGARIIKVALQGTPALAPAELAAVVEAAHARDLRVGAHALDTATVEAALSAGVDVLVHAPLEALSDDLSRRFCKRPGSAVISTLRAFGAGAGARGNLARMREHGCIVLYGTDLGNNVPAGIDTTELTAYVELGMSPTQALAAATSAPAAYFRLEDLGVIAPGKAASLLALDGDPTQDPRALDSRALTLIAGRVLAP
jgi:imidazolonepropionase-like amidohydrolase